MRHAVIASWRRWARSRVPELISALVGVGWFLLAGGWRALPPTSLDWLRGDPYQHVLGWLFFRRSGWGVPIGRIDGFPWPFGTTIGFTDANPLLAVPLKLIEGSLPQEFQYVGVWLAACFALQGWFGARLAALGSERPPWRVLGGSLFALSPVLLARTGHDTLCAHWAVLALLLLHLEPRESAAARRGAARRGSAVALLIAVVHPYLAFMVLALALALLARAAVERSLSWAGAAWRAVLLVVAQAALLAVQGYFTTARSHAAGFGLFATDLLGLVHPGGASTLLPDLPVRSEQSEGYAYLGAGGIALVVLAILVAIGSRRGPGATGRPEPSSTPEPVVRTPAALAPLLVVVAAMAAFAITPAVHVGGTIVLDLRAVFRPLTWATGPLRSSGRFIWPFYYLLLAWALVVVARRLVRSPSVATAVVAAALVLQAVDLAPRAAGARFALAPWRLRSPTWALARGGYDLLALYPPQVAVEGSVACRGLLYADDDYWAPLAHVAYMQGMAVNSAQLARGATRVFDAACESFTRDVEGGRIRPRTVYVVHPSKLPVFEAAAAVCGRIDGHHVCVSSEQRDAFRSALARR